MHQGTTPDDEPQYRVELAFQSQRLRWISRKDLPPTCPCKKSHANLIRISRLLHPWNVCKSLGHRGDRATDSHYGIARAACGSSRFRS